MKVRRLFAIARALRDQGVAIVYISHRLEEVVRAGRPGHRVARRPGTSPPGRIGEVTADGLIADMVGREASDFFARETSHAHRPHGAVGPRARPARHLPGHLLRRAGRRGAVLRRSWSARAAPMWAFALFGIAPADAGGDRDRRCRGRDRQSAPGDGSRHRLCLRRPAQAGPRHDQADRRQPDPADAAPIPRPPRPRPAPRGARRSPRATADAWKSARRTSISTSANCRAATSRR